MVTSSGGFLLIGLTSHCSFGKLMRRPRPRPRPRGRGAPSTPHPHFEAGLLEAEGVGGTGRLSELGGGGPAGRGGSSGGSVNGCGGARLSIRTKWERSSASRGLSLVTVMSTA